jgi:hypothetical protein
MAIVTDKYRGTGKYFLVFNDLGLAAKYRGTVTYQELADLVGLPIVGAHMGTEVGHVLGEISEDQHKLGRPMLSAVAVGVSGMRARVSSPAQSRSVDLMVRYRTSSVGSGKPN